MTDDIAFDDQSLIGQAAAGDLHAFETLMHRHNQKLYRAARSILHDDGEAEDAVQDAWWKAWSHLGEFRGEAQATTWLTRIAVNEALMRRRRNRSRDAVIQLESDDPVGDDAMATHESTAAGPPDAQPEQEAWRDELRGLIEQRIDALPEIYRTVFMLCGVEEMPATEVAAALGLPEATVRVRYMRARHLMQAALPQELDPRRAGAFSFAGARCDRIVAGVKARLHAAGQPRA